MVHHALPQHRTFGYTGRSRGFDELTFAMARSGLQPRCVDIAHGDLGLHRRFYFNFCGIVQNHETLVGHSTVFRQLLCIPTHIGNKQVTSS